jgi:hypothetical protein
MTAQSVAGRLTPAGRMAVVTTGAVTVLLAAAAVPLSVLSRTGVLANSGQTLVVGLPFVAVGALVAWRRPGNPIGWLMLAGGACGLLSNDAGAYAALRYDRGYRLPAGPLAVLLVPTWSLFALTLAVVVLLFPDGRLPSPRWRWVLWSYVLLGVTWPASIYVITGQALLHGRIRILPNGDVPGVDHPVGSDGWYAAVSKIGLLLLAGYWLAFVLRQVLSWRRADGEHRQQLKWLMIGAIMCLAAIAITIPGPALAPGASAAAQTLGALSGMLVVGLPVGIGIAILKYRLYEIDRIISRTLAYTIVTGLLVGVYAGLVLLATRVLPFSGSVAVAASTLAVAALFNPLRRRVQAVVDRRFNRARYDADQTVAAFAGRLKDAVDLDGVRGDLASVVHQTLAPAHVSVWLADRR